MVRAWEIGTWASVGRYDAIDGVAALEVRCLGKENTKSYQYAIIVIGGEGKVRVFGNEDVDLSVVDLKSTEYALSKLTCLQGT